MAKVYTLKVEGETRATGKGVKKTRRFTSMKLAVEKLEEYYRQAVAFRNDWFYGVITIEESKDGEFFLLPDSVKKDFDNTEGASHD